MKGFIRFNGENAFLTAKTVLGVPGVVLELPGVFFGRPECSGGVRFGWNCCCFF